MGLSPLLRRRAYVFLMTMKKPGVSQQTHLFLAALLWSVVGISLAERGFNWLVDADDLLLALPAIVAGMLKSYFILDRTAEKNLVRIGSFQGKTCIGGVYSVKTWILVILMIGAGRLLRNSGLPLELLGFIYTAIGVGLFFSSRLIWRRWSAGLKG